MLNKQVFFFCFLGFFFALCVLRLTLNRSLLTFALVQKGADGLRCGIAQDGVQHSLGELADHSLALVLVRPWHNPADLLQQVDDGFLQRGKKKGEGVKVGILRQ